MFDNDTNRTYAYKPSKIFNFIKFYYDIQSNK